MCKQAAGRRSKGTVGDSSYGFYETSNICGMGVNRLELPLSLKY